MIYEMIQEPVATLHRMPSDSEVIIASEDDGTGARHKVVMPSGVSARTLFKKPKWFHRFPFLMICVITLGLALLFIILLATSAETWFSSNGNVKHFEDGEFYIEHTAEDVEYHRKMVDEVNAKNTSWKAAYNRFASRAASMFDGDAAFTTQLLFMKRSAIHGNKSTFEELVGDTVGHTQKLAQLPKTNIPKHFDARETWPYCESIHKVENQGGCGSCYAVVTTSVIADRICIATNGTKQPSISTQDLISCCPDCGGCHGTIWALFSFNYWRDHGIVTGGSYGSGDGCKPYAQPPNCGSPCSTSVYSGNDHKDMTCRRKCHPLYEKLYNEDLNRAKSVYWVKANRGTTGEFKELKAMLTATDESSEIILKQELMKYGPMLACFVVYEEFQHYKTGIYVSETSSSTKELYGHCAKLIGWGEDENGTKYWSYMNTWGRAWGEHGFFKMAGEPEEAAGGIPLL
uniref:Pept_C1 domain-containing protein n=1 Tax=Panagrellus redivivus TaxID=6233 RepID=A0A7E5A1K5_PANRE